MLTLDALEDIMLAVSKLDDVDFDELKTWFYEHDAQRRDQAKNGKKLEHVMKIKKLRRGHMLKVTKSGMGIPLGAKVKLVKTKRMSKNVWVEYKKLYSRDPPVLWELPFSSVDDANDVE